MAPAIVAELNELEKGFVVFDAFRGCEVTIVILALKPTQIEQSIVFLFLSCMSDLHNEHVDFCCC